MSIFKYNHIVTMQRPKASFMEEVATWMESNMKNDFILASAGSGTLTEFTMKKDDQEGYQLSSEKYTNQIIIAFETASDATHFKLVWG